ncbi:adenylate isopentenyltransferase-like [Cucurbita pepo subsp. pepo]|uniref:adenylate isopentenyltransferase-like n=1 Tax=Cucurbita pepo subsp. pepo TaxID=3664 RepID=UPI000C9D688B|nr:adenylate isopentenyltransferase-like [Cucurbita pepo subsp. pepo]
MSNIFNLRNNLESRVGNPILRLVETQLKKCQLVNRHFPKIQPNPNRGKRKEKMLVILGATGCGKSGLSVRLGTHFPAEIINSDKMQVYNGLDITTNKIPLHERHDVPHHILGDIDSDKGEFTSLDFRIRADNVVSDIASRSKLPILVGGSNSFIHAMLVTHFNPNDDVFNATIPRLISSDLRYRCCFLWLDVAFPILAEYLSIRVDEMLQLGMFEELAEFYDPTTAETASYSGIRKAIGVPEFDKYFKKYPPARNNKIHKSAFDDAVNEIKLNTHVLAKRQIGKILKLKQAGWDINVLNATAAFRAAVQPGNRMNREEIWKNQIWEPSLRIVNRFLEE